MPTVSGRVLLGAMAAGISGAVLVGAVVLARGGQSELMTSEQFQNEGGVLHSRVELFLRQSDTTGAFRPQVFESWTRFEDGGAAEIILASHTLDGVLTERSRASDTGDDIEREPVEDGRVVAWPGVPGYGATWRETIDEEQLAEVVATWSADGFDPAPSLREGTLRFVGTYAPPPRGQVSTPFEPAYPPDLDVIRVEKELIFAPQERSLWIRFDAILADGSRVLIASRRHDSSLLPLSEWDAIEELVWGS